MTTRLASSILGILLPMPPTARLASQLPAKAISRYNHPSRTCIACFSHTARQLAESPPAAPKIEGPESSDNKKRSSNEKKRRNVAIPAFALFGVAIPLGWFLKNRFEQNAGTTFANPSEFVKYKLVGKEDISSTCAIFRLKPAGNAVLDLDDPALERAITSVEFKQPQLQIARSYTCLPQQDGQPIDEMRFLIRREQKGEVSNFLHRLPVGAEIEVRGLHREYTLPDDVKSVVFLVGGTGIAPAMQVADALEGVADVYILWASRRREDCVGGYNDKVVTKKWWNWWTTTASVKTNLSNTRSEKGALVSVLESLKERSASPSDDISRLKVDYFVDEEGTRIRTQDVKDVLKALSQPRGPDGAAKKFLFVSGPAGFITHWAGAKQWAAGREVQGPLGGVLSTMDLAGWEAVKL